MRFEIINPSDKAFCEASDYKTACIAITTFSQGKYGLKQCDGDGDFKMPPIFFSGVGWFVIQFSESFEKICDEIDRKEVINVLRSIQLEGERTSLNDIVGIAKVVANEIEESL